MGLERKYITIIASGGRTGTTFFGNTLSDIIENAYSIHEPDLLYGGDRSAWDAIKTFGFYHMIIGRLTGRTGIRNLTQRFLAGDLDEEQLSRAILSHREKYYNDIDQDYIIESYSQWYGILSALPKVFPHYKVIGVIRDPRTWVQSWMNYKGLFDEKDMVIKFGQSRLNPTMIKDKNYIDKWLHMSVFEKICWQWSIVTKTLELYASKDKNIRIFYFEDLFLSQDRNKHIDEMLKFITIFPDKTFQYNFDPAILDSIKNSSREKTMPFWQEWPPELCHQLHDICGTLMKKCGYGMEPEWQDKLL